MSVNGEEERRYQQKLFIVKYLLQSMQEVEEVAKCLAEYQKRDVMEYAWGREEIALRIDQIIPKKDIFYLIVLISPAKRKGQKAPFGEIYQFYKIEEDDVICEIVPSLKTPLSIRMENPQSNLENIISAISFVRGERVY